MFKKPSKKWTTADLLNIAHKLLEFDKLRRVVGTNLANKAVEITWDIGTAYVQKLTEDQLLVDIKKLLQKEIDEIRAGSFHITVIGQAAKSHWLSGRLNNHGLFIDKLSEYGATANDDEITKAAKWVIHKSDTLQKDHDVGGNPFTTAPIEQIKIGIRAGQTMDLWSDQLPERLHKKCSPPGSSQKKPREIFPDAHYPSIVGGGFLKKLAFQQMAGIKKPAPGAREWFDVAGFLFAVITRAHALSDGNGRVARIAYAVALFQGGWPFTPPTETTEQDLNIMP